MISEYGRDYNIYGEFNLWWEGKFKLEYKEREICSKIKKFLEMPKIIALTGLRRVKNYNNAKDHRGMAFFRV